MLFAALFDEWLVFVTMLNIQVVCVCYYLYIIYIIL